jgi:hypothetical protein
VTYLAILEKAGIPGVTLGFADQITYARNVALVRGVPNIRWVDVPRVGAGAERVAAIYDKVIKALTDPLTAKEKESGLYTPPPPARTVFEGTLDDAQEFFAQTTPVNNCRNCPIAKYTDGLPIIIPTEEKVTEMLTGTSHKADEEIYRYTRDATTGAVTKATSPVLYAQGYKSTVEKVAVCAVMAGCKPEYMPAVLAAATTGGGATMCPGSSGAWSVTFFVSGPFAKEIGMNAGQNALDVGNIANMSIVRAADLMTVNFGGCITGAVRTDFGSPMHVCFAEDVDGLPPGWEGFNEEGGYKKTDSVLGKTTAGNMMNSWGFLPSAFRAFAADGTGGVARGQGVEGIPGPHNILATVAPLVNVGRGPNSIGLMTVDPNMAKSLYDYGFKKKADIYNWLCTTYFITKGELYNLGWWDHSTNAGKTIEKTSGKPWGELPNDYKVPMFGADPTRNCIIVANGFADEKCQVFYTDAGRPGTYPIDVWR